MRRIWLLALAAALLTMACRMEMNILVDLNEDRSGSFGFEIGMDEELRTLVSQEGGGEFSFGDISDGLGSEFPGANLTERTEGDMSFTRVMFEFADEAQFQQVIEAQFQHVIAAGEGEGGDISVVWTDDTVTFNAVLEGTGGLGDAAGDLGGDFDLASGLGDFASDFFSGSVILSLPGEVTSHNADATLDDGRLQWDLNLDGSNIEIFAESDLNAESSFPVWALIVLVAIAIAVLAWVISMQRRRNAAMTAVGAAAGQEPAPPPMG